MKKRSKIILGFIVVLIVLVVAIIGGNLFIENKMETALQENLSKAEFKYENLNASILGRSASLSKVVYKKNGIQNQKNGAAISEQRLAQISKSQKAISKYGWTVKWGIEIKKVVEREAIDRGIGRVKTKWSWQLNVKCEIWFI